jgi:hypothetical protein
MEEHVRAGGGIDDERDEELGVLHCGSAGSQGWAAVDRVSRMAATTPHPDTAVR